jgi:hypothetical protein
MAVAVFVHVALDEQALRVALAFESSPDRLIGCPIPLPRSEVEDEREPDTEDDPHASRIRGRVPAAKYGPDQTDATERKANR